MRRPEEKDPPMLKKEHSRKRMAALLFSTALIAAACGSDTVVSDVVDPPADSAVVEDDAMAEDEEAMEDDAMAEDEEAMEDDAMAEDEDAMEDDAMAEDEDAMEDDAMEEVDESPVSFSFEGLEPLGENFVYEGWVIVDDSPVSTGRFTLEADGTQLFHTGSLADDLAAATAVVLTIEPAEGDDPAPADAHVLAGDIIDGVAQLSVGHPAALGNDFTQASGQFVLATPTTAVEDDELSGIWFIDIVDGAAAQGLDLPELPAGWVYEGWAVIDGQPVTTGRFTDAGAADDFNGFSGTDATGPNYPGEDFIQNAPEGLTFPTDLTGSTVVVSIEPQDDDSPAPFAFKPLAAEVPDGTTDHVGVALGAGPAFPTGVATITG
ncbi:MAG: anti-sigma factor [Acidimicrobiia bacterium]|nr:anti-sigma factor [Acidimicrobiia bacterium]